MKTFILGLAILAMTPLHAADHITRIAYNGFLPHIQQIHVGDTVTRVQESTFHHIVSTKREFFDDNSRVALPRGMDPFTSESMYYGDQFRVTVDREGTVYYACPIHEEMSGIIVVLPD